MPTRDAAAKVLLQRLEAEAQQQKQAQRLDVHGILIATY